MKATPREKGRVPAGLVRYLLGEPEPADLWQISEVLGAMRLTPYPEVQFVDSPPKFGRAEIAQIARDLISSLGVEGAKTMVGSVVVAGDPIQGANVDVLRQKLKADYTTSVFSPVVPRERPVRGPFGEATIELKPGATPLKQRPFHLQGERKEALTKLVDNLIRDGKLEMGKGPWSSPAFPVPKKKPGEYRLVVDYRALNDATVVDAHPLPRIEDILHRQAQYRIWSVLDMKEGYHQVPLKKEHRPLTCMTTPQGTMQWTVLFMGLKNGGAIFQRMIVGFERVGRCGCIHRRCDCRVDWGNHGRDFG